jgi:hypothetical protein
MRRMPLAIRGQDARLYRYSSTSPTAPKTQGGLR